MGSNLGSKLHPTKDVKNCSHCCSVRCAALIIKVGGMLWPKNGATYYKTYLGLPDKGNLIKELVVYWIYLT